MPGSVASGTPCITSGLYNRMEARRDSINSTACCQIKYYSKKVPTTIYFNIFYFASP
jgi:hypothetical protein